MWCIVSNVQCSARTPIAARSKLVLLLAERCLGERCVCVHPPEALRIRRLAVRTTLEAVVLLVLIVLVQMADIGGDEP